MVIIYKDVNERGATASKLENILLICKLRDRDEVGTLLHYVTEYD